MNVLISNKIDLFVWKINLSAKGCSKSFVKSIQQKKWITGLKILKFFFLKYVVQFWLEQKTTILNVKFLDSACLAQDNFF